jgi:hypothetical protein
MGEPPGTPDGAEAEESNVKRPAGEGARKRFRKAPGRTVLAALGHGVAEDPRTAAWPCADRSV